MSTTTEKLNAAWEAGFVEACVGFNGCVQDLESQAAREERDKQVALILAEDGKETIEYLRSRPLPEALWWFIENMDSRVNGYNRVFFDLRERCRKEVQK